MKSVVPPLIREDVRLLNEIAAEVRKKCRVREGIDPLMDGIVWVFARYCELLIERLNRIPETHQLAFFSLLGASTFPPVAAHVPLSFNAVIRPGRGAMPVVPQYTQVVAPPTHGETEPVVFETVDDLTLVRAKLKQAVAIDVQRQIMTNVDELLLPAGLTQKTMFADGTPVERAFHIGQRAIWGAPDLVTLRLQLEVENTGVALASRGIEWGIVTPTSFVKLMPTSDTTRGLTCNGEVIFSGFPQRASLEISGIESIWLTCRLKPDISGLAVTQKAETWNFGRITRLCVSGSGSRKTQLPQRAFYGAMSLDITKDFFPFGERPRFSDVFYIQFEAFASAVARTVIDIRLTNPAGASQSPIPPVSREGKPVIVWEAYTRHGWILMDCDDQTQSFTTSGAVHFTIPKDVARTTIGGIEGGWLRARLVSGNYIAEPTSVNGSAFPALAPPAIAAVDISTTIEYGPDFPEHVVLESNLEYTVLESQAAQTFTPFPGPDASGVALYLGLAALPTELSGCSISFFASPSDFRERVIAVRDMSDAVKPAARWQVRGQSGWCDCIAHDDTQGMRKPGFIQVRVGGNVAYWPNSTLDTEGRFIWMRIVWEVPDPEDLPCIQHISLNTIPAVQAITLKNELLGSSNGRPAQLFHTARAPIIGDFILEVLESAPLVGEESVLANTTGGFNVQGFREGSPRPISSLWTCWTCVDHLEESDGNSRQFKVDRLTGAVRFGNGVHGRIPPPGANNVRVRSYRTGGGRRGNCAAGTITLLRTTIPYVESVTNPEPSSGGQDTQSQSAVRESAAAWLRHRNRAVAPDDYMDLAREASPEVARAACVSATDLAKDATAWRAAPGVVSVMIVPHSDAARPQPALSLLEHVKQFLDGCCPVGVDVVVLGPLYVCFCVEAEIVLTPGQSDSTSVSKCEQRLKDFLHPLTGGPDSSGWAFGQKPHPSDFYPLLGAIEGIDHIRSLRLRAEEQCQGLVASGWFLACSGEHRVQLCC